MNGRKGNYNIFINESKFDIMKELNIRETTLSEKADYIKSLRGKNNRSLLWLTITKRHKLLERQSIIVYEKGFYGREYLRIRVVDQVEVDIACDYFCK